MTTTDDKIKGPGEEKDENIKVNVETGSETDAKKDAEVDTETSVNTASDAPDENSEVNSLKEEIAFYQRKTKNLEDDLMKYTNESKAYRERLERITAEYENYRNRTDREKADIKFEATTDVLKVMVPSFDNLERALASESDDIVGLVEGVKLTLEQYKAALDKLNVEEIDTENGFDPNLHDAMMHEGPTVSPEKIISQVFQKGYKFKDSDRVIRHSMVVTKDKEN